MPESLENPPNLSHTGYDQDPVVHMLRAESLNEPAGISATDVDLDIQRLREWLRGLFRRR